VKAKPKAVPPLPLAPKPKVRTKAQQAHHEAVTARNLFLQTRQGPVPKAIYP
jgi:hypothetical protein